MFAAAHFQGIAVGEGSGKIATESSNPVPEPGSLFLIGTGSVLFARYLRRRT